MTTMKPQWIEIIPKKDNESGQRSIAATYGMNVPGGCIIAFCGYMVYVPGINLVNEGQQPVFASTTSEDVEQALVPIRKFLASLQQMGLPDIPRGD